ncbi:MAG TPA: family 16 glycoside hydrolase [Pirellulaceae bacterium]|nr:family 16 glycoside hydrolase [Pirellulaceae bacterium]
MNEESIFAAAIAKKKPQERAAYLDEACQGNAELRAQVEELLTASAAAGSFFEHPPAALDATVDAAAHDTHKPAGWDGSLAFLTPTSKPGRIGQLAQYEIIEVVGSGGMGIVLRAFDTKLSRIVAVKVLAPELARNPTAVKRFLREAKAAAAVVHDHVVTIHNVEETHQPPFLVMQFIDGQTLQQKIDRQGALDLKEILRIGCQTAAGLAAAHKHGVIHRDVKPANILLENGIERVKITDFGLARAADDVEITQTGLIAGTPQYMSPEQARGESMDARGDLFSLGSVLYTMCTGRPAFRAETTMGVLRRVCDDVPRPIREVHAEIPQWLCEIVDKLLQKEPEQRFQSAQEVADLLAQHLAHLQQPESCPMPPRVGGGTARKVERTQPEKPSPFPLRVQNRVALAVFATLMLFMCLLIAAFLLPTAILLRSLFTRRNAPSPPMQAAPPIQAPIAPAPKQVPIAPAVVPTRKEGWVQLFNGQDLTGWTKPPEENGGRNVVDGFPRTPAPRPAPAEDGGWSVVDGVLVGKGTYSYLVSQRRDYRDFQLRAEVRINEGGNSGLYFRAELPADWKSHGCVGYEAEITSTDEGGKTGSLRRYPQSPVLKQVDETLVPPGEWFTYEVLAVGNQLATFVNGKLAATAADDTHAQGRIALQLIREETTVVEFRKIEIKELPTESAWHSLFNGQDLTGWKNHPQQPGGWRVENGALVGLAGAGPAHLFSVRDDIQDFELRAEVQFVKNASGGIYFRSPFELTLLDGKFPNADELQISNYDDPSRLDTFRKRSFGAIPLRIDNDDWFELRFRCEQNHYSIHINGKQKGSGILGGASSKVPGHLVLQVCEGTARFRNIQIKELLFGSPRETGPLGAAAGGGTKVAEWTPLFDGTSLSGWKTHSDQPGDWKVENGTLVGSGRVSHLFTERGDYQNFHLRFEAKLDSGGDSGILVRSPFAIEAGGKGPLGYEAQIAAKTGTLLEGKNVYGDPTGIEPGTWFTGEVIAAGKQIIVRINGQTTANFEDAERRYTKGHIALQVFSPQTVVQFRKIEIKELLAGVSADSTAVAAGSPAGAPPQEPTALIWGPVRDGWQVGIGWNNGKLRYAAGEKVEFELSVRNATNGEKTVRIVEPSDWDLWYFGGNELSLRISGRDEHDVKLAPREEKTIDVPNPQIDLAGLAGGTYRVKVTTDVGDKKKQPADESFGFEYDGPAEPPFPATGNAPLKHPDAQYAAVSWGKPVLGLSVGVRAADAKSKREGTDDEVAIAQLEFFLWNTGAKPADVDYIRPHPLDWQPQLRDKAGKEFHIEPILTGPKEDARAHLDPGQAISLGTTMLKGPWLSDRVLQGPLQPGPYQVWSHFNCRRLDYGHLNLRITSGEASVEIKP